MKTYVRYTYLDFPQSDTISGRDGVADGQEIAFGFSMPKLIGESPSKLTPYYAG
jgi:hypothetical protein